MLLFAMLVVQFTSRMVNFNLYHAFTAQMQFCGTHTHTHVNTFTRIFAFVLIINENLQPLGRISSWVRKKMCSRARNNGWRIFVEHAVQVMFEQMAQKKKHIPKSSMKNKITCANHFARISSAYNCDSTYGIPEMVMIFQHVVTSIIESNFRHFPVFAPSRPVREQPMKSKCEYCAWLCELLWMQCHENGVVYWNEGSNIATTNQLTLISLHHLAHRMRISMEMKLNANRIIYKRKKLSTQLHANEPFAPL